MLVQIVDREILLADGIDNETDDLGVTRPLSDGHGRGMQFEIADAIATGAALEGSGCCEEQDVSSMFHGIKMPSARGFTKVGPTTLADHPLCKI